MPLTHAKNKLIFYYCSIVTGCKISTFRANVVPLVKLVACDNQTLHVLLKILILKNSRLGSKNVTSKATKLRGSGQRKRPVLVFIL